MPIAWPGERREQLQHAPRAGAEIEVEAARLRSDQPGHRGLDLFLGDMQRADVVPLRGVGAEIGHGEAPAGLEHPAEPHAVAGEHRIVARQKRHDGPGDSPPRPCSLMRNNHPAAFLVALEQPASLISLRCRLIRGWLWPSTWVSSLTLSSPCDSTDTSRSRVISPTARNPPTSSASEPCGRASWRVDSKCLLRVIHF
jgi:hypothetical protein